MSLETKTSLHNFLNYLFEEDEYICAGSLYDNQVTRVGRLTDGLVNSVPEFFSINPLDGKEDHGFMFSEKYKQDRPRRSDINVTKFRNFLFEMDSIPLTMQDMIMSELKFPYTTKVYSGGKSFHYILSLAEDMKLEPNSPESVQAYKQIWKRLAAYIDKFAHEHMWIPFPEGKNSFIDQACCNPSRFSRYPGFERSVGDTVRTQTFVDASEPISLEELNELLEKCPKIAVAEIEEYGEKLGVVTGEHDFFLIAPYGLTNRIKYPTWTASEGCYPILFRLSLWAIDSVDISKEVLHNIYKKYVYPELVEKGYPESKLDRGINDAFRFKKFRKEF